MKRITAIFLLIGTFLWGNTPGDLARISLDTRVEPKRVPLNRTATLTVSLTYRDVMGRFTIQKIDDPILTNFEVVGTSASHQRAVTDSGDVSVQTFVYLLRPKTLGMGYVEAGVLTYRDEATGELNRLMTPRIGVEVIDAVPEPRRRAFSWTGLVGGVVLLAGLAAFFFIRSRRPAPKTPPTPEVSLEERYLSELKTTIQLTPHDRSSALSQLIRLYRRYLAEKYDIPAREATTAELIEALSGIAMEERLKSKTVAFFEKADAIRFSGRAVSPPEWEEAYTTVESVLETLLRRGDGGGPSDSPSSGPSDPKRP